MMSLSEDTHKSELATNAVQVKSSPPAEENHNIHEQTDTIPDKAANEHRALPAWLDKESNQRPSKVKLPPVAASANKKRKRHTKNPRENSKGKLNTAIEPVQEEVMASNVNA